MAQVGNWTEERSATQGSGDIVLGGVISNDKVLFRDSVAAGEIWYSIKNGNNQEAGIGTFDGVDTIQRTTVGATYYNEIYTTVGAVPIVLNGSSVVSITVNTAAFNSFDIGNPLVDGHVLSSTIAGVRSWVDNAPNRDIDTVAILRTTVGQFDGEVAYLKGYTSDVDGAQGHVIWNSTSVLTDNGGTVFAVAGVPIGRWVRSYIGNVNVAWFGAIADGATNTTAEILAACNVGAEVDFNSGTYVLDGLNLPGTPIKFNLDKDTILLHLPNSSLSMIEANSKFEMQGGTLDGNRTNQINRLSLINFNGDQLFIFNSSFKSTTFSTIRCADANEFTIDNCYFTDIADHTGVLGGNAYCIRLDSSPSVVVATITNNKFINGVPADTGLAPSAIIFSTPVSESESSIISNNTIVNFGTSFPSNRTACIEVYQNSDNLIINSNNITKYHFCGIRVNDSSGCIITNNIVADAGSSPGSGEYAIGYIGRNHGTLTNNNVVISNNIVDDEFEGGIYIAGIPSNPVSRGFASDNLIIRAGSFGYQFSSVDGDMRISGGSIDNATNYGVFVTNSTGHISVSDVGISNCGIGVFSRTGVTGLDISIDTAVFDSMITYATSFRDNNSSLVQNCQYRGSAPIKISDISSNNAKEYNNSWQNVIYNQTNNYSILVDDIGKVYTNSGAAVPVQFLLPITTAIPEGFVISFIVTSAFQVDLRPNAANSIYPVSPTAGNRVRNSGVIGSSIELTYSHANAWSITNMVGTWIDAGP